MKYPSGGWGGLYESHRRLSGSNSQDARRQWVFTRPIQLTAVSGLTSVVLAANGVGLPYTEYWFWFAPALCLAPFIVMCFAKESAMRVEPEYEDRNV